MKNLLLILLAASISACSDGSAKPSPDSALKRDIPLVKPDTKVDGTVVGTCPACASDEVCVQAFDGVCVSMGVKCVKVSATCKTGGCTAACDKEYCGGRPDGGAVHFTCQGPPCTGKEIASAIHCYGP